MTKRKKKPETATSENHSEASGGQKTGGQGSGAGERLQKIIAAAGLTSRRKAEALITEGRVKVNGQIVTELGAKADAAKDHIRVDGKLLEGPQAPRYYMLNKPKGYVTTVSDPEKRPTVMRFFERVGTRVFPVGRLDFQSEGLLLMTNDGALANALTRAAARVEKTYLVKVSGQPTERAIEQIRSGIMIERGRPGEGAGRVLTEPATIRLMRDAENPWYEVVLTEGRNRQIRKLFEEIGHHVEKIRRVGYGTLVLDVEPGEWRELDAKEVAGLERAGRPRKKAPVPPKALRKVEERNLPPAATKRKFRGTTKKRTERAQGGRGR